MIDSLSVGLVYSCIHHRCRKMFISGDAQLRGRAHTHNGACMGRAKHAHVHGHTHTQYVHAYLHTCMYIYTHTHSWLHIRTDC